MNYIDGEILGAENIEPNHFIAPDNLSRFRWKTAEGQIIPLSDMEDSHLRNAALFLMGMGYRMCVADESRRIVWLRIFRLEWERRLCKRNSGLNVTTNKDFTRGITLLPPVDARD